MIHLTDNVAAAVQAAASRYITEYWQKLQSFSLEEIEDTINQTYDKLEQYDTDTVRKLFNDNDLEEERDVLFNYCVQLEVLHQVRDLLQPPEPEEPRVYGQKFRRGNIKRIK